eukprot:CAMPEP_0197871976 /NCGR_PEP_ID=MMETSP1439-20131203/2235_1 /TAXON_ID=66791 /ORGANISM="Gonyaulax spinifera, Strain CCMP409" /LENGTH=35 /DNA_ID= /DNA_START= /DNA_END= /DNA_ORIENTATION=
MTACALQGIGNCGLRRELAHRSVHPLGEVVAALER